MAFFLSENGSAFWWPFRSVVGPPSLGKKVFSAKNCFWGIPLTDGRKWMRQDWAPTESLVEEIHVQRLQGDADGGTFGLLLELEGPTTNGLLEWDVKGNGRNYWHGDFMETRSSINTRADNSFGEREWDLLVRTQLSVLHFYLLWNMEDARRVNLL